MKASHVTSTSPGLAENNYVYSSMYHKLITVLEYIKTIKYLNKSFKPHFMYFLFEDINKIIITRVYWQCKKLIMPQSKET